MNDDDPVQELAERLAERGPDALVDRLRDAFAQAAAVHADIVQIDAAQLEEIVQGFAPRADGLQWRRALATVASEELGIDVAMALHHPAVARAQELVGAPSYEDSLADLVNRPVPGLPEAPLEEAPGDGRHPSDAVAADGQEGELDGVHGELESELEDEPEEELEDELETELESELETELEDKLETELEDELETELEDELGSELETELEDELESEEGEAADDADATVADAGEPDPVAAEPWSPPVIASEPAPAETSSPEPTEESAEPDAEAPPPWHAHTEEAAARPELPELPPTELYTYAPTVESEDEGELEASEPATSAGRAYSRLPQYDPDDDEDRLRVTAVHLGGVANLTGANQTVDLRLSDAGLDIMRDEEEIIGRLGWSDIEALEVPNPRGLRRRRGMARAQLLVRTPSGDASFEIPAFTSEELRQRIEPLVDRFGRR